MPYQSIFTPNSQRNFSQDFKPGQYAKVNATIYRKNNPQNSLLTSPAPAKSGNSLLSKFTRTAVRVGKDVGQGAENAGRAVVRPVADVVTGKGGKAVHDTAQLTNDVTGGSAGYFARNDIINPAKQLAAQATGNKKAAANINQKKNIDLGLGKKGTDLKGGALELAGNAVNAGLSVVGGGELGAAKKLLEAGGKTGAKELAAHAIDDATLGAVGGASSTLAQNPHASIKDVSKNAVIGAGIGGAVPIAAHGAGLAAKKVFGKGADEVAPRVQTQEPTPTSKPSESAPRSNKYEVGSSSRITPAEATQKLQAAGYSPDETKTILQDALPEKPLAMPGQKPKIGLNDASIQKSATNFDNTNGVTQDKTATVKPKQTPEQIIANDSQTKELHNVKKQIIEAESESVQKAPDRNLVAEARKNGGISSSAYEDLPKSVKNKNGVSADVMARDLGFKNEDEFVQALHDNIEQHANAPKTKAGVLQRAEENLKAGNSPYASDYKEITDKISTREADLQRLIAESKAEPQTGAETGTNLKPLESVGVSDKGVSKLGESVNAKSLKQKLIDKTQAEDLPTYNKADMRQQAEFAIDLLKNDPQKAIDVAMGKQAPPAHILSQMVYNAVEEHARSMGGDDGASLLLALARSKQVSNLTKMGQEIRAAAERDPNSPVNGINSVKVAREEAAVKRGKNITAEVNKDAKAVAKATPKIPKENWDSFIKKLTC